MAATLAQLGFDIDTSDIKDATKSLGNLDKQSGKSEKSASKFSRGYSKSMDVAKKSALAMSAAAIGVSAAIVKYTNDGLENIDMLAKLARAQNATADGIRAVQIAAGDAGLDGMAASLTRLTRRLGAAEMGNKEYGVTVDALGLSISELSKMDADEKIGAIADAIQSSGMSMEETARHLQNLGFEQSNANAFFRSGGDAVRNARGEVEAYGLSLSAVDTAKVEAANDAWSRTSLATEAATNQLAVGMTPVIQTVAQYLNDAAKEGDGFSDAIEKGVDFGVRGFAKVIDVVESLNRLFTISGFAARAAFAGAKLAAFSLAAAIVEGPLDQINLLIDGMNYLGADINRIETPQFINEMRSDAASAKIEMEAWGLTIHETLMKPLPGSGIIAHYEEVKKAAHDSAVAAVAAEKKANKERADIAADGGNDSGKEFKNGFESQTSRVADSLQDAITTGDWAGIGATIGATFASSMAQVVGQQVSASLGQNIAGAFGGPLAGAVAGGIIGSILSGSNSEPDYLKAQARQGTGSVLGDIRAKSESISEATKLTSSATSQLVGINQAMLVALNSVNAGIENSSASVSRMLNLDTLIGGASLVGQIDSGLNLAGGSISSLSKSASVNQYSDQLRTEYSSISGFDRETVIASAGNEVDLAVSEMFAGIMSTVKEGAEVFGVSEDIVKSFVVASADLSLEGLSIEERQQAISAHFGTVFDNLAANTIPWLTEFQKAGEGLGETLARVATETQTAQEAAKQLGFQFAGLAGQELAEASSQLIEFTGGIENLVSSMSGFIQNFASEAQQFEIVQNSLTSAFEQANLTLPETRQGYFDLLQAQNGSTAAGAENIATLLRLQSHANSYYSTLEEGAEAAAQSSIQSAKDALNEQERIRKISLSSQAESLNQYTAFLNSQQRVRSAELSQSLALDDIVRNALNGLSTSTTGQSQQSALDSILAITERGGVNSTDDLRGTVAAASSINASEFATFNDYIKTVSRTGAALSGLREVTSAKVTKDQQLLNNIEKEISAMSKELIALSEANVKQTAKSARILERIEIGGIEVKE